MRGKQKWSSSRSFLGFCGFALLLGTWLYSSRAVSEAVSSGLSLCVRVMIPSLFPFFVLSNLFVRRGYQQYAAAALRPAMGPLFGLPAEAAGALVLGAVGGYPIGAATAFQLCDRGELREMDAARLLAFCNNAGPGFIFGVVGLGLFGSAEVGLLLYVTHLAAALLVGAVLHLWKDVPGMTAPAPSWQGGEAEEPFAQSFVAAIRDAASAMLNVCAVLVFFSVILAFLRTTPVWSVPVHILETVFGLGADTARALPDGFLELGHGMATLTGADCPRGAALSIAAFLLGWGGLCVHCQAISLCGERGIAMGPYFKGKLSQGILSAFLVRGGVMGIALCVLLLFLMALLAKFRKTAGKRSAYRV